jgi:glycosyltransferase involved in cell wall biosynthesis
MKNKKITLSVIMPAYNSKDYIKEAVLSVLNQTFKDFELIVINDASTDNTLEILENLSKKDNRIKIINLKVNRNCGGDKCANFGISKARGKYIARMDADDIADPKRFEKQIKFLDSNPDIFLVGSNAYVINKEGKIIGEKTEPLKNEDIYKSYFGFHPLIHPTCMFRTKLLDGSKFKYEIRYSANNDYYTFFKLVCQGYKFVNMPDKLLKYRIHNNNATFVHMRTKFVNSLKIRLVMFTKYNYQPSVRDFTTLIAQSVAMFILPEKLLLKVYFLAKGIIKKEDLLPSFSFNFVRNFSLPK